MRTLLSMAALLLVAGALASTHDAIPLLEGW